MRDDYDERTFPESDLSTYLAALNCFVWTPFELQRMAQIWLAHTKPKINDIWINYSVACGSIVYALCHVWSEFSTCVASQSGCFSVVSRS